MRWGARAGRLWAAPGAAAWAALIAAPLVFLFFSAARAGAAGPAGDAVLALTAKSFAIAAGIAAISVVLGFLPGRLLAASPRGQKAIFALLLVPLLLPRYLLYYAWGLLLSPTTWLGKSLAQDPAAARLAGAAVSWIVLVGWYWPLAALIIAQGWRRVDSDVWDAARLDSPAAGRLFAVALPLLKRSLLTALAICFVLVLSEFGAFHLAGIRTTGTVLATLFQETWRADVVVRSAWPMAAVGLVVGVALSVRLPGRGMAAAANSPGRAGPLGWAVTTALLAVCLVVPAVLLVVNVTSMAPLREFYDLHTDELAWSILSAFVGAAIALLIAWSVLAIESLGRAGRWAAAAMQATAIVAMLLPGSLLAIGILRMLSGLAATWDLRENWSVVSMGQAARFGGLALLLLRFVRDGRERRLREMAAVDGATRLGAWWGVHLPRVWPVAVGAFVVVAMLGLTELPATMLLLPAGVPWFAQRLLNQMHYVRDQHVIASCLALFATYVVLAGVVLLLIRLARRRCLPVAVAALCVLPFVAGCGEDAGRAGAPEVVGAIGSTGRGDGEFLYPRAIDVGADGTVYVVDKTGRVQRLRGDGTTVNVFRIPETEAGYPTGVSIGPGGNIYVADTHYHRVLVFSPEGRLVRRFGRFGQGDGCFIYPTDVAFAPDGRIYVSEYGGNDRISVYSAAGRFLGSFGSPGEGSGRLSRPSAMQVDAGRGVLYVADACNHRIARYDLAGGLLGYIGGQGRGRGQLRYPYDLALGPDGKILVCEYGNNRVQVFGASGESLAVYGSAGRRLGQLAYPWGVAIDRAGRVFVVDAGNNRLQVWRLGALQ